MCLYVSRKGDLFVLICDSSLLWCLSSISSEKLISGVGVSNSLLSGRVFLYSATAMERLVFMFSVISSSLRELDMGVL